MPKILSREELKTNKASQEIIRRLTDETFPALTFADDTVLRHTSEPATHC
jgi:hypothetical protein